MKRLQFLSLVAFILFSANTILQSASPILSKILPRGGQRGSTVEMVFTGQRLQDIHQVLFYSSGFQVEKIEGDEKNNKRATATVKITPECVLGEHHLRLVTSSGLSTLHTFWVGPFPSVQEIEPNSEFSKPQAIPINHTIEGRVDNEDVDFYAVEGKKGQRLSVEVEALRLGNFLFDPYVAILNSKRFEQVAADDTALLLQDCFASIIVPEDGTYWIEVRDSSYGGNGNSHYRLHVGNFPRPGGVFPAGGKAGTEVEVSFLGDQGELPNKKINLPSQADPSFAIFADSEGHISPSPNRFRVSEFADVLEIEPNENRAKVPMPEITPPMAFNGIIQAEGDTDYFTFKGQKGQRLVFTAHARSLRSPLDPVMNLYHQEGKSLKSLKGSDDVGRNPDSKFDFTLPADGQYFLRVRDHLGKGGPNYIYRIEVEDLRPELRTFLPQFGNNDTQSRQMIPVARGNRYANVVQVTRRNIRSELDYIANNLPPGVKMHAMRLPPDIDRFPVVFEAAPDAPIGGTLVDLKVRQVLKPEEKHSPIEGGYSHNFVLVRGPGNTDMYSTSVNRLAVSVTEEVPFKIEIEKPATPILQRGSLSLKVRAIRKEGFDEQIVLRMLWNPPGIGSRGTVNIPKGKSEVSYPLTANGGATVGTWKIAILGEANAPDGQIFASSMLTDLTVEQPYLNMKIEMAAIERGKEGEVYCTVETLREFEGEAQLRLIALPSMTTTVPVTITKDTKEISFPIKTEVKARAGITKNLFIAASIPVSGNKLSQTAASSGHIRIDNPPPPRKKPPAKPKVAPKPKPVVAQKVVEKPKKPLSRLEKLRLLAKERVGGQ